MFILTTRLELKIYQPDDDKLLMDAYREGLFSQLNAEKMWFTIVNANTQKGEYKIRFFYPTLFNDRNLILQVINKCIYGLCDQIPFIDTSLSIPTFINVSKNVFDEKLEQHGFKTEMERYLAKLN